LHIIETIVFLPFLTRSQNTLCRWSTIMHTRNTRWWTAVSL